MKQFRDQGAVGALLDEYERAIRELQRVLRGLSPEHLTTIVDTETTDQDCVSIQSILTHVLRAGHWYALEILKLQGESIAFPTNQLFDSTETYQSELNEIFRFTERLFARYPNITLEENDPSKKILTKWGQQYDVEQMMEHAIVHILRHRRQIERFKVRLVQ